MINRFGSVEAEGGGFVMEFADFIEAGIPVLTAVAARHQSGWQRFTGGLHAALPADEEALWPGAGRSWRGESRRGRLRCSAVGAGDADHRLHADPSGRSCGARPG